MRDILAQIEAMLDPSHPKNAVFIGLHGELPQFYSRRHVFIGRRRGAGILLTTDPDKAAMFGEAPLSEAVMAYLLDYPEPKSDVELPCVVLQVRNAGDAVLMEAVVSLYKIVQAMVHMNRYKPDGGSVVALSMEESIFRRRQLIAGEAHGHVR